MLNLLLIPTPFERERIPTELRSRWTDAGNAIATCGFGMAIAGIRTVQAIREVSATSVVLLGIAGAYSHQLKLGTAVEFSKVSCCGIGAGAGEDFQSSSSLGWLQCVSPLEIGDHLGLDSLSEHELELLSVTSASAGREEADWKSQQFPSAVAEDMEGFSVASACRLEGVPIRIIRGISNFAGDRDHRGWQIDNALDAAMKLLLKTMKTV